MSIDDLTILAADKVLNTTPPLPGGVIAFETVRKAIEAYEAAKASEQPVEWRAAFQKWWIDRDFPHATGSEEAISREAWQAALATKRESIDVKERFAIRNAIIEEVAKHYHGAMADLYKEQGDEEPLAGIAEDYHSKAYAHRIYAREIREQVWLKDEFKPNQIEGGSE